MITYPIEIGGKSFEDKATLKAAIKAWAVQRRRRHRGDVHPAAIFSEAARRQKAADAIADIAAELLQESNESNVLELIAHIQLKNNHPNLYEALLNRLEKGDLPGGEGLRHGSLEEELQALLYGWLPEGREDLAKRAKVLLEQASNPEHLLHFLLDTNAETGAIKAALQKTRQQQGKDPYLETYAQSVLAKRG